MQPPQEKKNREYIKAAQIPNKNRCASNDWNIDQFWFDRRRGLRG
jgi:hypothetical protein